MAWYTAIFLGLVQGLAEFLPISSSGHLMLFEHWFGIETGGLLFTVVLHVATLLAVMVVYYRQVWEVLRHPLGPLARWLLLATVVTCGMVILFKPVIDQCFSWAVLPFAFVVAGLFMLLPYWLTPRTRAPRWWQMAVMGLAQGVAVVPGLSRSGLTITAGQLCGVDKSTAADWSFLMSLPIIVASLVYELWHGGNLGQVSGFNLGLAFVSAFVSGLVAIKLMLNLVRKIDLRWFAFYLLLLGGGLLLGFGFGILFHVRFQMF